MKMMVKPHPSTTSSLLWFLLPWLSTSLVVSAWKAHSSVLDPPHLRHHPKRNKPLGEAIHRMRQEQRKLDSHGAETNNGMDNDHDEVPFVVLYDGVWTNRWYGEVLTVPSMLLPNVTGSFDYYSETAISCLMEATGLTMEDLAKDVFSQPSFWVDNETVQYNDPTASVDDYFLEYSPEGEAACKLGEPTTPVIGDEDYERDPVLTYTIFRQWFLEQYPFFDIAIPNGGYDTWANLTNDLATQIAMENNVTDQELFDIMVQSLIPLQGPPFVGLYGDAGEYESPLHPFTEELDAEYDGILQAQGTRRFLNETVPDAKEDDYEEESDEYQIYRISQLEAWQSILQSRYLSSMYADLDITYGTILNQDGSCRTGYISYIWFTSENTAWRDNVMAAHTTVKDCSSLILDVRFNPGGYDPDAIYAASHLAAVSTKIFSKRNYLRDTTDGTVMYTPYQDIYMDPPQDSSLVYNADKSRPMVVLTSGSTGGAAERFVWIAKTIGATVMGQRTNGGGFGDIWGHLLPNGWWLVMAKEEYVWADDGVLYEGIGFPVDIELTRSCDDQGSSPTCDYFSPLPKEERENGEDTWLQQAIDHIDSLLPTQPPNESATPPLVWGFTRVLVASLTAIVVSW